MISPQFRPILGGYERVAERLSLALAKRGHAVTVAAERRDPAWPRTEYLDGVKVCRWWCRFTPGWHALSSLMGFGVFMLRHGQTFDLWHVHQYGVHAALAVVLGRVLRRPVVLKLTSSQQQGLSESLARGPFPRLVAALHRRVDAVVALTRETLQEAASFGIPAARIRVLGNGVDVASFASPGVEARMRLRQLLGLGEGPVVVYVGRLAAVKNPDGLLRAWNWARPHLPGSCQLVFVGDGPMRAMLVDLAETDCLGESVRFVGQQGDVARWLAASDLFVLPSHNEGLSNAMLEAMASGLPVLTTRVSGAAENVEETGAGIVVDTGDMERFSHMLVRLLTDPPLRERMGAVGRSVVEERYSLDRVAELHERLYEDLLRGQVEFGGSA